MGILGAYLAYMNVQQLFGIYYIYYGALNCPIVEVPFVRLRTPT